MGRTDLIGDAAWQLVPAEEEVKKPRYAAKGQAAASQSPVKKSGGRSQSASAGDKPSLANRPTALARKKAASKNAKKSKAKSVKKAQR